MARRLITRDIKIRLRTLLYVLIPIGGIAVFLVAFLWIGIPSLTKGDLNVGVTFSIPYARELGLNWRETLTATLDDLNVRYFRIPVYWSAVEPKDNEYDWASIDYQLNEIAQRNGKVILAVGAKLPRWPECWIPEWALHKGKHGEREARLRYIEATINRYKNRPEVIAWQVENEALFPFGVCPKPSIRFLKQEIDLVRKLDIRRPITTTDSGELSTWFLVGSLVDRLGISTYRTVTTFWGTVWHYWFIPPYWYARRATLLKPLVKDVYVSEFQMEPWSEESLTITPLHEQYKVLPVTQMKDNFDFAERMRFKELYLWGVEWWWWMRVAQQDDRYWETAKTFFEKHGE